MGVKSSTNSITDPFIYQVSSSSCLFLLSPWTWELGEVHRTNELNVRCIYSSYASFFGILWSESRRASFRSSDDIRRPTEQRRNSRSLSPLHSSSGRMYCGYCRTLQSLGKVQTQEPTKVVDQVTSYETSSNPLVLYP